MASVVETYTSRQGTTAGFHGHSNVPRTFIVTLNAVSEDPIATCRNLGPDIGDRHPQYGYLRASDYTIRDRLSQLVWLVDVSHVSGGELSGNWIYSVSTSLESEHILETVEKRVEDRKSIGPRVYRDVQENESPTHRTDAKNGPVWLIQTPARNVVGYDRGRPVTTLTLSRIQPNYSLDQTGFMAGFVGTTNVLSFFGARKRTLLFQGADVQGQPGTMEGQRPEDSGVVWSVRLLFSWKTEAYTPATFVHTWRDEEGNESRIRSIAGDPSARPPIPPGQVVTEDFTVLEESDYNSILRIFD